MKRMCMPCKMFSGKGSAQSVMVSHGQDLHGFEHPAMACRCARHTRTHGVEVTPRERQSLLGQNSESLVTPPEMWLADALDCSLHELVGILQDAVSLLPSSPDGTTSAENSNARSPAASAAASYGTSHAAHRSLLATPQQRMVQHPLLSPRKTYTRPWQRPCGPPFRSGRLKQRCRHTLIASRQLQRVSPPPPRPPFLPLGGPFGWSCRGGG